MRSGGLPETATVAVIGAGTMGSGIAQVAAQAGHAVLLHDAAAGAAARAIAGVGQRLGRLVEKGRLGAAERDAILARLRPCTSLADLAVAELVVEAVVEQLEVKAALFRELEEIVPAGAILATNTSSLSITALAARLRRPERVVGMHFFNPAQVMPLVEVVSGLATAPEAARTVFETAARWGKSPIHARSTPGFIVNRVARPFYGEALRVAAEGAADPATLDGVVREAGGFPMGPFELMDAIGSKLALQTLDILHEAYGERFRAPALLKQRVRAGFVGGRGNRGWRGKN
jgi:3-hydroxybutyryl-CoA dehydrogenase